MVFATAGVAGLRLQYQQAQARAREKPPLIAEKMDVKLVGSPARQIPNPQVAAAPAEAPPDVPAQLPVVVEPSPEIPFAVPTNQPFRKASTGSPVQHLTFGTGEGDKPAPEYPREAKIARQQGTVVVRFTVDADGHVVNAEAFSPSPYPLLNQAAVRAVRETWDHFPAGKVRVYDVSFQFELHQK
jgi:protein TonB